MNPTIKDLQTENAALRHRIAQLENQAATTSHYQQLFENSLDGIFLTAPDGSILAANPAACKAFDRTEQDIIKIGRAGIMDLTDPRLQQALEERARTGKFIGELNMVRRDGTIFPVGLSTNIFTDSENNLRTSIIFRDLTEIKNAQRSQRETEHLFDKVFDASPIAINIFDPSTGRSANINRSFLQLIGYTSEEVIGHSAAELNLFVDLAARDKWMKTLRATGVVYNQDAKIRTKSGEIKNVLASLTMVNVKDQPMVMVILSDITDRFQIEEKLYESENRYHQLIEVSPVGVVVYFNGKLVFTNQAGAQIIGASSPSEIIGRPFLDFIHPNNRAAATDRMKRMLAGEKGIYPINDTFIKLDGSEVQLEVMAVPINYQGKPAVQVIVQDISGHLRILNEKQISIDKLNAAMESMTDAVFISNTDGRLIDFNDAFVALNRFKSREECATHFAEFSKILHISRTNGQPVPVNQWPIPSALRGETATNVEFSIERKDTAETWIASYSYSPIRNKNGTIVGAVGIARDITARKQQEIEIQKSHDRLELAMNSAKMAWWEMDLRDGHVSFDPQKARMLGFPDAKFNHYMDFVNLIHPDDHDKAMDAMMRHIEGKAEHYEIEFRILTASGKYIWFYDIGSVVERARDGQPAIVTGVTIDITRRMQIEEELITASERLDLATRSANMGIWDWDIVNNNLVWDDQMHRIYGIKRGDFPNVYEAWLAGVHPDDRERSLELSQQAVQGIKEYDTEFRTLWPDGSEHWLKADGQVFRDDAGKAIRMVGINYDITEQKQAVANLQKSEENYRLLAQQLEQRVIDRTAEVRDLYDNAPTGYHSLDTNGRIILINQTELNWLGYTREELIGTDFKDLFTPQSKTVFQKEFPHFLAQGWINNLEFDLIRKDGSIFHILLNATAIYDAQGKIQHSRSTLFDITERKRVEDALAASEAQLRVSRDNLRYANLALEKAALLKDEFLASMSHELRTPLTGILGLSEALQYKVYGDLTPKQETTVKNIEISGTHLLSLINDVLDLSKIEAGQLTLQPSPCYLSDICRSTLQLTKGLATKKNQKVTYSITPENITVQADPRRLKQMIVNLLSNAIKFTPKDGSLGLTIEGNEAEQVVRLTVWDTGIGIQPDDLARLFQPFVQVDSSLARQSEGSGLGLSLVKRMAELHGGGVEVESIPSLGSRFTIVLPWVAAGTDGTPEDRGSLTAANRSAAEITESNAKNSPLILIVDDNLIIGKTMADVLEASNYRTAIATDGLEAIKLIPEINPNLVIMDIQMPLMDGFEVITRLRSNKNPQVANVPIIAVTALAMTGDRERCLKAGANEYISKPVQAISLMETIQHLLSIQK